VLDHAPGDVGVQIKRDADLQSRPSRARSIASNAPSPSSSVSVTMVLCREGSTASGLLGDVRPGVLRHRLCIGVAR